VSKFEASRPSSLYSSAIPSESPCPFMPQTRQTGLTELCGFRVADGTQPVAISGFCASIVVKRRPRRRGLSRRRSRVRVPSLP
jgi:hypothetical protein